MLGFLVVFILFIFFIKYCISSSDKDTKTHRMLELYETNIPWHKRAYFYADTNKHRKTKGEKKAEAYRTILSSMENSTLHATVIASNFQKLSEQELLQFNKTGKLFRPYLIQKITFGNKLNKAIKLLLENDVVLKRKRLSLDTYIILEDSNTEAIASLLGKITMNENLRIKLEYSS